MGMFGNNQKGRKKRRPSCPNRTRSRNRFYKGVKIVKHASYLESFECTFKTISGFLRVCFMCTNKEITHNEFCLDALQDASFDCDLVFVFYLVYRAINRKVN